MRYSFDAEKAYLSIARVFRAIPCGGAKLWRKTTVENIFTRNYFVVIISLSLILSVVTKNTFQGNYLKNHTGM